MLTGKAVEGVTGTEGVEIEGAEGEAATIAEAKKWAGKFDSEQALEEGYLNLEKKLGAPRGTAPEEYSWGDYAEKFDMENTPIGELATKARELRLTQDEFLSVVDAVSKYQDSFAVDTDAEIAKLGDKAQARLDTINTWASNHLTEKGLETLGKIGNRAEVIELMDEIRQLQVKTQTRVPVGDETVATFTPISVATIRQTIKENPDKYLNDSKFREEINKQLRLTIGED